MVLQKLNFDVDGDSRLAELQSEIESLRVRLLDSVSF